MPALWIASASVTDDTAYAAYAREATEVIETHGGIFLARGARHVTLEGADRPRHVVIRFPSVELAEACYNSVAYRQALAHAAGASEREVVIVEITDPA